MTPGATNVCADTTEQSRSRERCCCPCIGTKRVGKLLRTLVVISNILYWFAGCTVLSISIWLRFVDVGSKDYFSTFPPFDIALYVVLVASILYLVVSFVGTCAANTKNEMMITLYVTVGFGVILAEIISLIVFSHHYAALEKSFKHWYDEHFLNFEEDTHSQIVHHVQSKMRCCGLVGPKDFYHILSNQTIPTSCMIQTKIADDIIRPEVYSEGCTQKLTDLVNWLLESWPISFTASIILLLQISGIITSSLFLQHIFFRRNYNYDDEDEDETSGLIDSQNNLDTSYHQGIRDLSTNFHIEDLPHPKVIRIVKSAHDSSFGFTFQFDDKRKCYLIHDINPESNAEYAGLTVGSELIEMNGMLLQGVLEEEVYEKMELSRNELRMVVVDEKTDVIYRTNKVFVNLKNVEGVTDENFDYKPRLCTLTKSSLGFGFHLLYLEDRKGEYIEEVAERSPAYEAGLNIGDRIIEVNGVNIEKEKSSDVVRRIRMSGNRVSLLVVDPKTDGYYRKKGVTITASLSIDYFNGRLSQPISSPPEKHISRRDMKPRYCRLQKSGKEDFGLYVVIDNNRIGQVIRWVDCGGPADRAGLRIGDRIIEVNGHSVEYESHKRLITCISINSTLCHFIVVDEDYDRVYKRNKPRLCHIFKEAGSFGFCICHAQSKDGHYVEEVDEGGPADRAGLKVGDRLIQINTVNVERDTHLNVLNNLRECETEVILLVIDSKSNKHYRKMAEFKSSDTHDIDYDTISIPDEPLFLRNDDDSMSEASERVSLNINDSLSDTKSRTTVASEVSLKGKEIVQDDRSGRRQCIINMRKGEKQGFFLSVDRDRNGQVIRRVEKGGPADRAGLRDGDRILCINGEKINNISHDKVVNIIRKCGAKFDLTVIDQRSDDLSIKHRPYLFRLVKDNGGYGFYLWQDENGHYVEDVTIGSPADKSGMRSGDRIIEVNGVNVEEETHEEVFYRVKACTNVVTLLAVDLKTFKLYKTNNIPVSVFKAESSFSGYSSHTPDNEVPTEIDQHVVSRDLLLTRHDGEDFGFNLAYSNSFMGDGDSGAHVVHWVEAGGVADLAGLRDGDKIIAIDGEDVTKEDHDHVVSLLYQVGKYKAVITIQYTESQDAYVPHVVNIKKVDNSFGFHLWFDENGHYIEDVTIGFAADEAGLKTGDRVLEVNGTNVEETVHADVVSLVRRSGEEVKLLVYSVQNKDVHDFAKPTAYTITKEEGTFGFTIVQDDKGFHFDYVAEGAPADNVGIRIGDRLMEVNNEAVSELPYSTVVSVIRASGKTVTLLVMSFMKNSGHVRHGDIRTKSSEKENSIQILNEILGMDGSTHATENRSQTSDKKGTDLRSSNTNEEPLLKMKYSTGEENLAFTRDEDESTQKQELLGMDSEWRYLEEKLSQAVTHATKLRRNPGRSKSSVGKLQYSDERPGTVRRKRNLSDIERKLTGSMKIRKDKKQNVEARYIKEIRNESLRRKQQRGKESHFRLVTSTSSLRERWNFEQRDSRRPGEVKHMVIDDTIMEEKQENIEEENEDIPESLTDPNETETPVDESEDLESPDDRETDQIEDDEDALSEEASSSSQIDEDSSSKIESINEDDAQEESPLPTADAQQEITETTNDESVLDVEEEVIKDENTTVCDSVNDEAIVEDAPFVMEEQSEMTEQNDETVLMIEEDIHSISENTETCVKLPDENTPSCENHSTEQTEPRSAETIHDVVSASQDIDILQPSSSESLEKEIESKEIPEEEIIV